MGECIIENELSPVEQRAIADIFEKHAGKNFAQLIRVIYQLEIEVAELSDANDGVEQEREQLVQLVSKILRVSTQANGRFEMQFADLCRGGERNDDGSVNHRRQWLYSAIENKMNTKQWDEQGYEQFVTMIDSFKP